MLLRPLRPSTTAFRQSSLTTPSWIDSSSKNRPSPEIDTTLTSPSSTNFLEATSNRPSSHHSYDISHFCPLKCLDGEGLGVCMCWVSGRVMICFSLFLIDSGMKWSKFILDDNRVLKDISPPSRLNTSKSKISSPGN